MAKIHIILIITILILGGFSLFLELPEDSDEDSFNQISRKAIKEIPKSDKDIIDEENTASEEPGSETSLSPDSPSSSLSGGSSNENLPSLPDIEKNPCGFYFDEYEICGGFCPDGECVQEEGSCYCKLDN